MSRFIFNMFKILVFDVLIKKWKKKRIYSWPAVLIAFIAVLIFLFGLQIRDIGGEKNLKND